MKLIRTDKTKFLNFGVYQEDNKKTYSIAVIGASKPTDPVPLGIIRWYGPWRKYVFYPRTETLFDAKCLTDIVSYLDKLMQERKEAKAK